MTLYTILYVFCKHNSRPKLHCTYYMLVSFFSLRLNISTLFSHLNNISKFVFVFFYSLLTLILYLIFLKYLDLRMKTAVLISLKRKVRYISTITWSENVLYNIFATIIIQYYKSLWKIKQWIFFLGKKLFYSL